MTSWRKRALQYSAALVLFVFTVGAFLFYLRYEGIVEWTYVIPDTPSVVLTVENASDIQHHKPLKAETKYKEEHTMMFQPQIPVSVVKVVYSEQAEERKNASVSYTPNGEEDEIKRKAHLQVGENEVLFAFPQAEFDTIRVGVHDLSVVQAVELYEQGAYVDYVKHVPHTLNTGISILLAALLVIVFLVSNVDLKSGKGLVFPVLYMIAEMTVLRYCLKTRTYEYYSVYVELLIYAFLVFATAVLCVAYNMLFKWHLPLHKVFALCGFAMGLIMMLLIRPFGVPDEYTHYLQAYIRSNEMMGIEQPSYGEHEIREEDLRLFEEFQSVSNRITYKEYPLILDNFSLKNEINEKCIFVREGKITSAPLGYSFSAIGLTLGRILNLSGIATYYMGCLVNLLVYVGILTVAVCLLPFGKAALIGIGMTPIAMQQAASFSYDGIVTALAFLFVSYVLHLSAQKQLISIRQYLLLCVFAAILGPSKAVYAPLTFAALLIPAERYAFGKKKWIYNLLIVAIGFGALLALQMGNITRISGNVSVVNEKYTISYLMANIKETINLFLTTFEEELDYYLGHMFNMSFGWLQFSGSNWLYMISCVLFVIGCQQGEEDSTVAYSVWKRWGIVVVFAGIVILTMLTLLMDHTPFGSISIAGIQGRYFIPLMITLIPLLRNKQIIMTRYAQHWCVFMVIWVNLYSVADVLRRIPSC